MLFITHAKVDLYKNVASSRDRFLMSKIKSAGLCLAFSWPFHSTMNAMEFSLGNVNHLQKKSTDKIAVHMNLTTHD